MTRKVSKRKSRSDNVAQDYITESNVVAIKQGAKKKSWSVLDIKAIKPLTDNQAEFMRAYFEGNHVVAAGSAGVGKSYLALWLSLNTILSKEFSQNKIIIVRSIVTTGRDLGALPGTEDEKLAPFEAPYRDICHSLLGKISSYDDLKTAGKIEFMPTTFVRGMTWDNAVIIMDESQNFSAMETNSCITRVGNNSKLIVLGDSAQNDRYADKREPSGFNDMIKIFERMGDINITYFNKFDIVRSGLVKSWIIAKEDLGL